MVLLLTLCGVFPALMAGDGCIIDDCDCCKAPVEPDCAETCIKQALANSNVDELKHIWAINPTVADRIVVETETQGEMWLTDPGSVIGRKPYGKLRKKFEALSPLERWYLVAPPSEKMHFIQDYGAESREEFVGLWGKTKAR